MALIRCPECGKEISDSAQVCPNCGCKTELGNQNEIMKTSLLADIGFTYRFYSFRNNMCYICICSLLYS